MASKLQQEIAQVLSSSSEALSANRITHETNTDYQTVYAALAKLTELNLVEKFDDKTYLLTDLGVIEFGFSTKVVEKMREARAKPKYKPMNEIKGVKSALAQTEKAPVETTQASPIVQESALTQNEKSNTREKIDEFENRLFDEIETRSILPVIDSAIEDFETRAKSMCEVDQEKIEEVFADMEFPPTHKHFFSELDDDSVFSPQHYNQGGIECIEALQACMSEVEFRGALRFNAMKYLWRLNDKATPQENLKKARWYIDTLLETFE